MTATANKLPRLKVNLEAPKIVRVYGNCRNGTSIAYGLYIYRCDIYCMEKSKSHVIIITKKKWSPVTKLKPLQTCLVDFIYNSSVNERKKHSVTMWSIVSIYLSMGVWVNSQESRGGKLY